MKFLATLLLILGCQAVLVRSQSCTTLTKLSGDLSDSLNNRGVTRCWLIKVPKRHFLTMYVEKFDLESSGKNGLEISELGTGKEYKMDDKSQRPTGYLKFVSDVKLTHYALNVNSFNYWSSFKVNYRIEKGYLVTKFKDSLQRGVGWLRNQSSEIGSWEENTPRAAVALHLASAVTFDGKVFEEELMANQVELKTAVSLMKPPNTISELSMLVNALLVTCYNPRRFHKMDVVQQLKSLVHESSALVHPLAYLALCNANETWPERAFDDLDDVLNDTSSKQATEDKKAMAVMALACHLYHRPGRMSTTKPYDISLYNRNIEHFKKLQFEDGSFGNVYTTAFIAQALIADQEVHWRLNKSVEYLVGRPMNFLTAYLVLPILNGKSLVDISHIDCSAHPRKHADEIAEETKEVVTPIMQIKYSLFYGEKKEVIQAMYFGVPVNSTAYYVMEQAEAENPKYYTFDRKNITGSINVFEIAGIPNDPESENYWMLFVSPPKEPETIAYNDLSVNKLVLKDAQHIVMWYRNNNL